jgi:outer membrane receptor for ferrienterochelin and colicin
MRVESLWRSAGRLVLLCGVVAMTLARGAPAQTSTGSIRGYVTDSSGAPISGARVVAVNPLTTAQREVATQSNGFYALLGLVPAQYDVTARQIGMAPQKLSVRVLIGEVYPLDFKLGAAAVQLEAVTVAAASGIETRTSEIATNVTQQQIERLPTASRNFLDLAALAPGVTISDDRINSVSRTFSAGGQTASTVNVFVDGTSLKNDLTNGGVAGQDASKGNPFPRAAIQEYRVISQNFKAEYQKASSAIITATTKSGTNEWHGNALFGYQNKDLVALDSFQRAVNVPTKPDYSRSLASFSIGGPLQKDRLFFFGAYEGNYQNRTNLVNFRTPAAGFPDLDTVNITKYNGNFGSPFRETNVFGKLNYMIDPKSSAELSVSTRHETDVRDFANVNCPENMCAFNEAVNHREDVTIVQLKHNRFAGAWLNEAKVDYSRFRRNPVPETPGLPARVYSYRDATLNMTNNFIGSNLSTQDFTQKRLGLRDDLTYTSGGQHVFKTGVSVDFVTYDVFKGNDETPRFAYRDSVNGHSYKFRNPYELRYGTGNAFLSKDNQEIGAYVQDDWSPTPRLTINVGIRWDFETKMMNYDYVTPNSPPFDVVDTLTRYRDSLPTKLDLNRYISTGSNRKPFYGAFQPRFGFSYAVDRDNTTTVFGGIGIYYDRTIFDVSVDETLKLSHPTYTITFADSGRAPGPGEVAWNPAYLTADKATLDALVHTVGVPEAWLIDKDVKVPKSYQWNVGVRRLFGSILVSAAYAGVRGVDQLALNWAQFALKPDGTCCISFNLGAHGFSNFIYSTNDAKTWYDALQVTVDRPYRRSSENFGWGAGLALTYATRSVQGQDNLGDLFDFPNTIGIPKHPANDEKSRVVANWTMDLPYLYGVQFSGLITLGSGQHRDSGGPPRFNPGGGYVRGGFTPPQADFILPNAWAYRTVDVRLRKDFPNISGTTLGVTLDVFNVFNYSNFDYNNFVTGTPSPSGLLSDPRRAQLGVEYNF